MNYFVDDFGTVVHTHNTVNIIPGMPLCQPFVYFRPFYSALIRNDNPSTLASIGSQLSYNVTLNSCNFANHKFEKINLMTISVTLRLGGQQVHHQIGLKLFNLINMIFLSLNY